MANHEETTKRPAGGEAAVAAISGSRLAQRPWRAFLLIFAIQAALSALLGWILFGLLKLPREMANIEAPSTIALSSAGAVLAYLIAPYFLRIPYGRGTFREYLGDIRLTRFRPFFRLVTLAASCLMVLIACQGGGSIVYRLIEGKPVALGFVRQVFDLSLALPPRSMLLIAVFYTMFEEVAFRGVLLRMLLRRHSAGRAILYSALAFGLLHLPAVFFGRSLMSTLAQVIWAALFGLFYAELTLRADSLFPAMVVHWLANVFQQPLTAYWETAPAGTRALLGIVFGYGLATLILIPWVRCFARRWLPGQRRPDPARAG